MGAIGSDDDGMNFVHRFFDLNVIVTVIVFVFVIVIVTVTVVILFCLLYFLNLAELREKETSK